MDIYYNQAVALAGIEMFASAMSTLDSALKIDPENFRVMFKKGDILLQMKKYEEAI